MVKDKKQDNLSRDMRFPTILYVRPAKAHEHRLIRAFAGHFNTL